MNNKLKYVVLSRNNAERLSFKELNKRYAIISITDSWGSAAKFAPNPMITAILELRLDDVDSMTSNSITDDDADRIVGFVDAAMNNIDYPLVHCEAGVSRSAGVCAAIMRSLAGDDSQIFDTPYYKPNMYCYRKMLEAFQRREELDEEQNRNNVSQDNDRAN